LNEVSKEKKKARQSAAYKRREGAHHSQGSLESLND